MAVAARDGVSGGMVLCAFVFFAFTEEARKYYRSVILSISKRIGIAVALLSSTIPVSKLDSAPISSRRDSFDTPATIPTFLVDACPSHQSMRSSGVDDKKPLIARVLPLRILRSQRVSLSLITFGYRIGIA